MQALLPGMQFILHRAKQFQQIVRIRAAEFDNRLIIRGLILEIEARRNPGVIEMRKKIKREHNSHCRNKYRPGVSPEAAGPLKFELREARWLSQRPVTSPPKKAGARSLLDCPYHSPSSQFGPRRVPDNQQCPAQSVSTNGQ